MSAATATYKARVINPSPHGGIRRKRRTAAEIAELRRAIYAFLRDMQPATVRAVFYNVETRGLIAKTQNEYKNTIVRLMVKMRREGVLPYGWVSDSTRWQRKPRTYGSMEEALRSTARAYRRALWDNQDVYVEVWCEKDALAGTLVDVTYEFDVPLMVGKGYGSDTYIFEAAQAIKARGKPAYLYYFGDHDPSGVDMERVLVKKLREFAPGVEIHFSRVAVTPEQIESLNLPTRETKLTDSRSRNFKGASVELDALPPAILRALVRECIERHINQDVLNTTRRIEELERETLDKYVGGLKYAFYTSYERSNDDDRK
jgi:hypothetical protein